MGIWLTKVRAKTHGGKIVTSDHRFKQKAEIGQYLNRIMDTGKYMSCGASTKWVEEPDDDDVLPSVFKSNYERRKFYESLQSHRNRTSSELKLPSPNIVCEASIFDPCVHCDGTGGVVRHTGRGTKINPAPLQQTQPVHSICIHGTKHGKCYKCRLEVLISRAESTVDDEEHRCC